MAEQYALERITDERTARIALSYMVPLGSEVTGRFLRDYGAVETLRFALDGNPNGLDAAALSYWRGYATGYDPAQVAHGIRLAKEQGLTALIPDDPGWPVALDALGTRAPMLLWVRGTRPELLTRPEHERVSIVGARAASGRGMYDADQLAVGLSLQDVCIVSTASQGIARAALSGPALGPGGAITVMPHSIENPDSFTPNGFLRSVGENGLLVSECSPGRTPGRDALHSQQRIIAALSAITTVIESGAQGEAVQTALIASKLHRQVAVVEGAPGTTGNAGPRLLLERYGATPVRTRDDVTMLLGSLSQPRRTPPTEPAAGSIAAPAQPVMAEPYSAPRSGRESLVLSR